LGAREQLAVIGDPISHSLSPVMQSAALQSAGLDWSYGAQRVTPDDLPAAVRHLHDGGFRGFNVTIPHKESVRPLLHHEDDSAIRVGAVNTVARVDGQFVGFNTDVAGFTAALLALHPDPRLPAVVFGTGGSARAVCVAFSDLRINVTVVSRDPERARILADTVGSGSRALTYDDSELIQVLAFAGIVINATPLGMAHLADLSPVPVDATLRADAVVMDLVYGRETPLVRLARRREHRVADGIGMLVEQGALAFGLWTGMKADKDAMRHACVDALLERTTC
jgi:shikimate dehydrogenase